MKRCLMFAAVMFSAALFGVYGSSKIVNGQPPIFEEVDPEVGVNAQDMVPRYNGSALVAGSINDDGAGNVSIQNGQLDLFLTTGGFIIPRLTITQRDALTAVNGMMIYNTENGKFEGFEEGAWVALSGVAAPSFTCGVDQVQDADGNMYNTVLIGNQCWMGENLRVGTRIDGASNQTDNAITEKYCFNNDPAICLTDGGLYQWNEMMQYTTVAGSQGICPDGWHLPSDNEWKTLEMELGMSLADADGTGFRGTDEGDQLKTAADCFGGVNCGTSGFQALLAGNRGADGSIGGRGFGAVFWSSTGSGANAWERGLGSDYARVTRNPIGKAIGFSVRCVKD